MMFRIVKKHRGYIVEVKKYRWTIFGLKYKWIPYIKTSGIDEAWHHGSIDAAVMNLRREVGFDALEKYKELTDDNGKQD